MKKLFSKIVQLSRWFTFFSALAWLALNSLGNSSRPVVPLAVPYSTVATSRQQEHAQEREQQNLKILDVRKDKTQPFYDYKVSIYLEDRKEEYDVLRITKFIDYEKNYVQEKLHPIFRDEDLNRSRENYAKRHIKRNLPELMFNQLLTKLENNDPIQDIYANLSEIPDEVNRRLIEFQNQLLRDYCFSFFLGKEYDELKTKKQNYPLGRSERETKLYYLTEARMDCIHLELARLGTSIVDNLVEMQAVLPGLNQIRKEDLDVYYSYKVYNAALEAYDAQAVNAQRNQRNQRLIRAKRAVSIAGLTFAGVSVVGGLFSLW